MTESTRPVIVLHAKSEFEAQMARDLLQSSMIPVLHIPSLSTGIFGSPRPTRVAVPEEHADAAVELLRDAGFEAAHLQDAPRGAHAFTSAAQEAFPAPVGKIVLIVMVAAFVGLIALSMLSGRP